MPNRDGSGPLGAGPLTGRGAGRYAGFNETENAEPTRGRGFRRGGTGRGRRHWHRAAGLPGWLWFGWEMLNTFGAPPANTERGALQNEAEMLQQRLDAIKKRLEALDATTDAAKR